MNTSMVGQRRATLVVALVMGAVGCGGSAPAPARTASGGEDAASAHAVEAERGRLEGEGATEVAIVVLDPRDGRVLASSGPVEASAPMGSSVKPFTVAAALEAGLDPERRFDGEGGSWVVDGTTEVRDYTPSDSLSARDVLVRSSNIGAAKIVEAVGAAPVEAMFARVGAEAPAGGSWLLHGGGVDVRVSPLALARAYGALANGGELRAPGEARGERLCSPEVARAVGAMLEAAVSDEGTGHRARVPGVRVAGKTGTPAVGAGVFAGFAPVDAPRYVVVIRAEAPGAVGGTLAAPAFSRLVASLLADAP